MEQFGSSNGLHNPKVRWFKSQLFPQPIYLLRDKDQRCDTSGSSWIERNLAKVEVYEFEPRIASLQIDAFIAISWLRELDSCYRPSGYEPDELPNCSIPRPMFLFYIRLRYRETPRSRNQSEMRHLGSISSTSIIWFKVELRHYELRLVNR